MDSITNPENVTTSAGRDDAITATASPRPWRVIDKPNGQLVLYTSIVKNSDGRDVAFVCCPADAALIVDAVNLKARIDEAMADESVYLYPVVLDGKPMVCVTPPPSEAEESRMHREYEASLLEDRERFRRCYYKAEERNDRLRDIVRRSLPFIEGAIDGVSTILVDAEMLQAAGEYGAPPKDLLEAFIADARRVLREASAAIGEEDRK